MPSTNTFTNDVGLKQVRIVEVPDKWESMHHNCRLILLIIQDPLLKILHPIYTTFPVCMSRSTYNMCAYFNECALLPYNITPLARRSFRVCWCAAETVYMSTLTRTRNRPLKKNHVDEFVGSTTTRTYKTCNLSHKGDKGMLARTLLDHHHRVDEGMSANDPAE